MTRHRHGAQHRLALALLESAQHDKAVVGINMIELKGECFGKAAACEIEQQAQGADGRGGRIGRCENPFFLRGGEGWSPLMQLVPNVGR